MDTDNLRREYSRVYKSLGRAELQRGASELDDLGLEALFEPASDLWLSFYTEEGLHLGLERYGFLDEIRERGYEDIEVRIRTDDPEEHLFRLISVIPDIEDPLVELVTERGYLTLSGEISDQLEESTRPVLNVEWLMLQHPMLDFTAERPPLPGQLHPGLGLGKQIFELLRNVCRRLNLEALVTIPSYVHNGLLYEGGFHYFDPTYQGRLEALRRDLFEQLAEQAPSLERHALLAAVSWAARWEMVRERDAEVPFSWFHEPMVSPLSEPLERYLEGEWYTEQVEQARQEHHYELLVEPLLGMLRRRGLANPFDLERIMEWLPALESV